MREGATDLSLIVEDVLGPRPERSTGARPESATGAEPTALRELMDWVSSEVFGPP